MRSVSCFIRFFCLSALCPAFPLPTTIVVSVEPFAAQQAFPGRPAADIGASRLLRWRAPGAYRLRPVRTVQYPSAFPCCPAALSVTRRVSPLCHDFVAELIPESQLKRHDDRITVLSRNRRDPRGQEPPLRYFTTPENQIFLNRRVEHFALPVHLGYPGSRADRGSLNDAGTICSSY
jgi:hypothetical protein